MQVVMNVPATMSGRGLYRGLLFLWIGFVVSCQGQKIPNGSPRSLATPPPEWDGDPYFFETRDTVSTSGPRSITRNIVQDQAGNFWFATWQGIMRYDGKTFTNFTNRDGLRRYHVFSVLEDKTGNLWFGTIGAGVYRYDGKSFTNLTEQQGLVSNWVECMLADRSGNVWFGTNTGISRFDGKSFANFTVKEGFTQYSVHAMAEDKNGKLWFGTDEGVCCYDGKSFINFVDQNGQPFRNVRSIIEDKAGDLWIGGADGLIRYDGKAFTRVTEDFIGYIIEDRVGDIWFCASQAGRQSMALYRYDGQSATEVIRKDIMEDTDNFQIFGITEDRAGNIWFGTMKGACMYDGKEVTTW